MQETTDAWRFAGLTALGLELTDSGFDFSVLSEFRSRLIEGKVEHLLFEQMLLRFQEQGLLKAKGRQRTDSTHILAAIRTLSRLELVTETLINALNILASVAPHWLKTWVPQEWFDRYEKRITEYHLPDDDEERLAFAQTVGIDGHHLLEIVYSSTDASFLKEIPAIEILRQVWVQQYYLENNQVYWREKGNLPPAAVAISSPHDAEARYSNKRETTWVGYKVHLTETCDEDAPHLITSVTTTVATEPDNNLTAKIHEDLAEKSLLPQEHLVDAGYSSVDLLRFRKADCQACPSRQLCSKSRLGFRELTFSEQEDYLALEAIRKNQHTKAFKQRYNKRAGVEGTISCATNAFSMRTSRYRGLAKTHLQHVRTACAINLNRVIDWFDERPTSRTRTSHFAALAA